MGILLTNSPDSADTIWVRLPKEIDQARTYSIGNRTKYQYTIVATVTNVDFVVVEVYGQASWGVQVIFVLACVAPSAELKEHCDVDIPLIHLPIHQSRASTLGSIHMRQYLPNIDPGLGAPLAR